MNFELRKDGDLMLVETHEGEIHLHLESDCAIDTEGVGHGCVTGMWMTRHEAVQLRDALTVALFVTHGKPTL